ncbi:MAG: hypothetical protein QM676_06575 [Novosphingobium sp.]
MSRKSPLDDPEVAAFAWARYKRLMRWMMLLTLTMVVAAVVILYRKNGLVSIHFYIATALGISFAMLLTSALMGLVFLSHGTGHDKSVAAPDDEPGARSAKVEAARPKWPQDRA